MKNKSIWQTNFPADSIETLVQMSLYNYKIQSNGKLLVIFPSLYKLQNEKNVDMFINLLNNY